MNIENLMKINKNNQMTKEEYIYISCFLSNVNFLVFGTGNDSDYWRTCNNKGYTIFLENKKQWIDPQKNDIMNVKYTSRLSEEKISESEKEKQIAEAETETQTISSLQDSISDMNENNTESSVTEREILETTTEQVSQQAPMNITNISAPKQKPQPIPSIPGRDNSGANADIGVGDSPESIFFMEFMSYMRRGYNIAKGIAN